MKLVKIGRDNQCNLILRSMKVSALHAEMTLMDNGEIYLEDKSSTNGTFVGGIRIEPNVETKITFGDKVVFGDTALDWTCITDMKKENSKYKKIYNIGKNFNNDIRLTGHFCSRFHAMLRITGNNHAMLVDTGSKNGTKVNGVPLKPGVEKRIKRGDNVICGDEDISEQIRKLIPIPSWPKILAAAACVAILILGGWYAYGKFAQNSDYDRELASAIEKQGPAVLRPATVYVRACYHYEVKIEDCPISTDVWDGVFKFNDPAMAVPYQATAFFVDREGRMVTNRHVAVPWNEEYRNAQDPDFSKDLQQNVERVLNKILYFTEGYALYLSSGGKNGLSKEFIAQAGFGGYIAYIDFIVNDAVKKATSRNDNVLDILASNIRTLKASKLTINGKMDYITVGYAGRNYTHTDEFERCDVLIESGTPDQDIAILQLNRKKTPEDIKFIYDINYFNTKKLVPLEDKLYVIGYPLGLNWGLDDKLKSLEPSIRETKCSKEPSRYTFDFQDSSQGGASGSPVFDEKGRVVGVLSSGAMVGPTQAIQAKYIKELYEKVK